ncbi:hypothetical protein [Bacillus smithii]
MKKLLTIVTVFTAMIGAVVTYHSLGISVFEAMSVIAFIASGALLAEKLF